MAPDTLNKRGTLQSGAKPFETAFAVLWLVLSLCSAAVAGLDVTRSGWSRLPDCRLFYMGIVSLALPVSLGTWVMLENKYFEQFVRIQEDRRHRVVTNGPYRMIRHPGYLGAIVGMLATPAMLGSAWTFIPAGIPTMLFVARTHREDRVLRRELPGYEEYERRTRFRLVPFVW